MVLDINTACLSRDALLHISFTQSVAARGIQHAAWEAICRLYNHINYYSDLVGCYMRLSETFQSSTSSATNVSFCAFFETLRMFALSRKRQQFPFCVTIVQPTQWSYTACFVTIVEKVCAYNLSQEVDMIKSLPQEYFFPAHGAVVWDDGLLTQE